MDWRLCQDALLLSRTFHRLAFNSVPCSSISGLLRLRQFHSVVRTKKPSLVSNQRSFTVSAVSFQKSQGNASADSKEGEDEANEEERKQSKEKPDSTALVTRDFFDRLGTKSKDTFLTAIEVFIDRDKHARGHVEFIYSALKHMKDFGVHRDLAAYKKLVDVFPKGKFIATNMWQVEFMHYPKQQQCGIDILSQMELMGVMPDTEMEEKMVNIFGNSAFPVRKLRRMFYWMPKFKNLCPWPMPDPLPEDSLDIAKLALERMTSVDLETKISVFYPLEELPDSIDPTWIVSGQSPTQQRLINEHPADRPIYVEGAFRIWLRSACINYFILRTEPKPVPAKTKDEDDVGFLSSIFNEDYIETEVATVPSVHEQEDGVILAICATGTSSHDSLLSWIRFLERSNPRLGKDISILFTLKSPLGPTDDLAPVTVSDDRQRDGYFNPSDRDSEARSLASGSSSSSSLTSERKDPLSMDPQNPDLSQVGIEEKSDTRFINWPHHYYKNRNSQRSKEPRHQGSSKESPE